jgi:hypothetical protein
LFTTLILSSLTTSLTLVCADYNSRTLCNLLLNRYACIHKNYTISCYNYYCLESLRYAISFVGIKLQCQSKCIKDIIVTCHFLVQCSFVLYRSPEGSDEFVMIWINRHITPFSNNISVCPNICLCFVLKLTGSTCMLLVMTEGFASSGGEPKKYN